MDFYLSDTRKRLPSVPKSAILYTLRLPQLSTPIPSIKLGMSEQDSVGIGVQSAASGGSDGGRDD